MQQSDFPSSNSLIASNPMLAETYEDPRMKFIAEKVEHHPFVMAYHAEGEGWDLSATSSGKTKFWGQSYVDRTIVGRISHTCR